MTLRFPCTDSALSALLDAKEFERAQELVDSVPEAVKWSLQRRLDAANRAAQGVFLLYCLPVPEGPRLAHVSVDV